MTIEPDDELDARVRSLEAERARPMARWAASAGAGLTDAEQVEQRQTIARAVARTSSRRTAS